MVKSCYIHIPFCSHICSYCDFSKMYYNASWCKRYLKALKKEIEKSYQGEYLDTIYIGGGTPSALSTSELKELFSILKNLKRSQNCEITIECNIENITREKLNLFLIFGINRISIGVESSNDSLLNFLERPYTKKEIIEKVLLVKEMGFSNINLDLMYAIPNENIEILKEDLTFFLELDVPHISTYSLMIEEHTKLKFHGVKTIKEEEDLKMYQIIHNTLQQASYSHYEISNFAKKGFESKHNLTYWKNEEYYGFGLGASGFLDNIRYTNTKSFQKYEQGAYRFEEENLTRQLDMENEIMLGLRTIEGISKERFMHKFKCDLKERYEVSDLIEKGYLIETKTSYYIPFPYWYLSNEIIVRFIGE